MKDVYSPPDSDLGVVVPVDDTKENIAWPLIWRMAIVCVVIYMLASPIYIWLFYPNVGLWPMGIEAIKLRPSGLYFLMAVLITMSTLILKLSLPKLILGNKVKISDIVWNKYSYITSLLIVLVTVANAAIALTQTDETWVLSKGYGGVLIIAAIVLSAIISIGKNIKDK